MRTLLYITMFILTLALVSAFSVKVYYDDITVVTLTHDHTMRDVQVKTFMPQQNVFGQSGYVDIKRDDTTKVYIDHEETLESGVYPVMVFIEDEDGRVAKKGTWIIVP